MTETAEQYDFSIHVELKELNNCEHDTLSEIFENGAFCQFRDTITHLLERGDTYVMAEGHLCNSQYSGKMLVSDIDKSIKLHSGIDSKANIRVRLYDADSNKSICLPRYGTYFISGYRILEVLSQSGHTPDSNVKIVGTIGNNNLDGVMKVDDIENMVRDTYDMVWSANRPGRWSNG